MHTFSSIKFNHMLYLLVYSYFNEFISLDIAISWITHWLIQQWSETLTFFFVRSNQSGLRLPIFLLKLSYFYKTLCIQFIELQQVPRNLHFWPLWPWTWILHQIAWLIFWTRHMLTSGQNITHIGIELLDLWPVTANSMKIYAIFKCELLIESYWYKTSAKAHSPSIMLNIHILFGRSCPRSGAWTGLFHTPGKGAITLLKAKSTGDWLYGHIQCKAITFVQPVMDIHDYL